MVDQDKVKEAIRLLLEAVGEDPNREGLLETPDRIARMYVQLLHGMEEDGSEHLQKTFQVDNEELVLVKDIPFYSMCEHHMLPFYGVIHVAYVPQGQVVGLSKIPRTVETFARRLQIQERLCKQVADAIQEHVHTKGVMVMAEAEHLCMTMRGIEKPGSKTVTFASTGVFRDNDNLRMQFLHSVGK